MLGSDKTIFLHPLSLAKIKPHNKPMAPPPWIKTLHSDIGFFRVWVNGKLSYKYNGPTKSKGKKVYQKFGVYRSFMSRYKMAKNVDLVPGQVVYFDEVRTGKSCSKLKLEQLDYDCKDLLSNLN